MTPTPTATGTATPTATYTPTATPSTGHVAGLVYWDANDNQRYDRDSEPPLGGATLTLRRATGDLITQVVTGADGRYSLGPHDPATYVLECTAPLGYTMRTPQVVLAVGANLTTAFDFAARALPTHTPTATSTVTATSTPTASPTPTPSRTPTVTSTNPPNVTRTSTPTATQMPGHSRITGRVWEDLDADRMLDVDERTLPGVRVFVVPEGMPVQPADPVTAWTDEHGIYLFINVAPGAYRVVQSDLPGFSITTQREVPVTIVAGQPDVVIDFGYRQSYRVHLPLILR